MDTSLEHTPDVEADRVDHGLDERLAGPKVLHGQDQPEADHDGTMMMKPSFISR